jgi:hypothetical protein
MTAAASPTMFATLSASFFARQLAIIVRVEPREVGVAASVELLTGEHAVVVSVRLKHTMLTFRPALVLGQSDAAHTGERRKSSGGEQYFPH